MRVLLVSPLPPPAGGIATWTTIALNALRSDPTLSVKHLDTAVRWKTILNRSLFLQIVGGSIQAFWDVARILCAIATFRPNVLHLSSTAGYASPKDLAIMLVARAFTKGGVIHYHTSRLARSENASGWRFQFAALAMRAAAAVVVLDQTSYAFLRTRIKLSNLRKIPNMLRVDEIDGVAARESTPTTAASRRIVNLVFVGHVVAKKGLLEQVQACAQFSNVHLHLVGPATRQFRSQLERLASGRPEEHWLHFYGPLPQEEVWKRILLADILLLPSHDEGFPMSVLEGMALQKPVVVSDVGAMREMTDIDGAEACGICVSPQDGESLRAGLQQLLADPGTWRRLGANGRKRIDRLYRAEAVIRQIVELWTDTTTRTARCRKSHVELIAPQERSSSVEIAGKRPTP